MKIKNIFTLLNGIVVMVMLGLSLVLLVIISNFHVTNKWVTYTYNVINRAELLVLDMVDQETGMRGYVVTGDEEFLDPYYSGAVDFEKEIENLKNTISQNSVQVAKLESIEKLSSEWHVEAADRYISIKDEIVSSEEKVEELILITESGIGKQKMDTFRDMVKSVEDDALRTEILYHMVNMETGLRGYIINGDEEFLGPYYESSMMVHDYLDKLDSQALTVAANDWIENVAEKQIELKRESLLYKTQEDLLIALSDGKGKQIMDQIRVEVDEFIEVEQELLVERNKASQREYRTSIYAIIIALVIGVVMAIVQRITANRVTQPLTTVANRMKEFDPNDFDVNVYIDERHAKEVVDLGQGYNALLYELRTNLDGREKVNWIQEGLMGINAISESSFDMQVLLDELISYITKRVNGQYGAVYILDEIDEQKVFQMYSSFAFSETENTKTTFKLGEGLIGQSAKEKETMLIKSIPSNYVTVKSGLGDTTPESLIIVPCKYGEKVIAVVEIASLSKFDDVSLEYIDSAKVNMGIIINNSMNYNKVEQLLVEANESNEKLQTQQEELRVANEELEQQSEALMNSQSELESQQEELRVTNEELEENTKLLETQKWELVQKNIELVESRKLVEKNSEELEQSNQYKSEFLANMSHELRTPLNSILILSELLGEDSAKLDKKQKEYANTINTSGRDLLELINDILDLSKVEAGKVEMDISEMEFFEFKKEMIALFKQQSVKQGIKYDVNIADDLPKSIKTDETKLKQIIKNLLSNAFKFTSEGSVILNITRFDSLIKFEVADTGIGISDDKIDTIFEAFKQEDGTTSRKYGGTGLGLSISAEYAKLLEGKLTVESAKGVGSKFAITIPHTLIIENDVDEREENANDDDGKAEFDVESVLALTDEEQARMQKPKDLFYVSDDRDDIDAEDKVLLIIDDDPIFATTIMDISRANGFKVIVAETGESGLLLADYYLPTGIILDVMLPGIKGWEVLDRLKNNLRTKDIPVNIVSGKEYDGKMTEMDFKFFQKPVSKLQIETILQDADLYGYKIDKILLMEADEKNQQPLIDLIKRDYGNIEIVCSSSSDHALDMLKTQNIDLIVLDLEILEGDDLEFISKLKREDGRSSIPVIVYTSREVSKADEKKLRHKVENIIIKDGESTQRLMDEIKIFMHNVKKNRKSDVTDTYGEELFPDKVILIVDDDMRNVFALSSILESVGITSEIANNGEEAIEVLNSVDKIDLVLMDIMMPTMDGYEATKEIRKINQFKDLPIVALTAKAMKGDREACIEAGANEYITKPVDKSKLLSLLRVWL